MKTDRAPKRESLKLICIFVTVELPKKKKKKNFVRKTRDHSDDNFRKKKKKKKKVIILNYERGVGILSCLWSPRRRSDKQTSQA